MNTGLFDWAEGQNRGKLQYAVIAGKPEIMAVLQPYKQDKWR